MATQFYFQKPNESEYNIEDYFAVRVCEVRGLNPPQPKDVFTRDWASEDGVDYFLATIRKIKSSEVTMSVYVEDSAMYMGMQVKAIERYRLLCDYLMNGTIRYRDTLQNQQVNLVYQSNRPVWYQFVSQGKVFAEFTFLNPSGIVTQVEPEVVTGTIPVITSVLTDTGIVPYPFTYTITADNDPLIFDVTNLPLGLSINTSTGVISGTPLVSGVFNCFISASNGYGNDIRLLVLTIYPA